MAPAAFGVSVSQVSLLINQIFASFLPTGSVSWLYYADRLMELPAGVLGVAVGTILLPSLSKYHADANHAEYAKLLDWGLRITVLLAVPAAAALAVLALPLVATLFHYGRFGVEDAWMTRQALVAYSLGLVGMILVKILAPGFYARQNVADAGEDRPRDAGRHAGDELRLRRPAQARRPRAGDRPGRLPECASCCICC